MKNWCRIFHTDEIDILILKETNVEEEKHEVRAVVFIGELNIQISKAHGFKNIEKRDEFFNSFTKERALLYMQPAVDFALQNS